jgi:hypothetical protein
LASVCGRSAVPEAGAVIVIPIHVSCQAGLVEIVRAFDSLRRRFGAHEAWQKYADKDGEDGGYDEQFG